MVANSPTEKACIRLLKCVVTSKALEETSDIKEKHLDPLTTESEKIKGETPTLLDTVTREERKEEPHDFKDCRHPYLPTNRMRRGLWSMTSDVSLHDRECMSTKEPLTRLEREVEHHNLESRRHDV